MRNEFIYYSESFDYMSGLAILRPFAAVMLTTLLGVAVSAEGGSEDCELGFGSYKRAIESEQAHLDRLDRLNAPAKPYSWWISGDRVRAFDAANADPKSPCTFAKCDAVFLANPTDDLVAQLIGHRPNLRALVLEKGTLSDKQFEKLADLSHLASLDLINADWFDVECLRAAQEMRFDRITLRNCSLKHSDNVLSLIEELRDRGTQVRTIAKPRDISRRGYCRRVKTCSNLLTWVHDENYPDANIRTLLFLPKSVTRLYLSRVPDLRDIELTSLRNISVMCLGDIEFALSIKQRRRAKGWLFGDKESDDRLPAMLKQCSDLRVLSLLQWAKYDGLARAMPTLKNLESLSIGGIWEIACPSASQLEGMLGVRTLKYFSCHVRDLNMRVAELIANHENLVSIELDQQFDSQSILRDSTLIMNDAFVATVVSRKTVFVRLFLSGEKISSGWDDLIALLSPLTESQITRIRVADNNFPMPAD